MVQSTLDDLQTLPEVKKVLGEDERHAHLLVVDDDKNILKLCEIYLKAAEHLGPVGLEREIHCAESGEQVLEIAERIAEGGGRIACALIDVLLPGIDGIEAMTQLWSHDPDVQCTLMTGAGKELEQQMQARIPGVFLDRWDYLTKPFTEFEVVQRVRRSLSNWCAHRREEQRRGENLKLVLQLAALNNELEELVESHLGQTRTKLLSDLDSLRDQLTASGGDGLDLVKSIRDAVEGLAAPSDS